MPSRLRRLPLLISAGLVVLLGLRLLGAYDALPPVLASHFDAAGQPNGYESKPRFALLSLTLSAGTLALFAGLPRLLHKLPTPMINMPNREYWLAPPRKAAALLRLGEYLDWFACATIALLVAVFELVLRANLAHAPLSPLRIWLPLGAYLGFSVSWSVALLRAFRLPPGAR